MAQFDMSLDALRTYAPHVAEPADFDTFWRDTLDQTRAHDLAVSAVEIDSLLGLIDTYDVSFAGFGGTPVKAWLHVPAGATGPLPTVVQYHGYSGGRGFPHSFTQWAQAGWAHFVMDTRGQGSGTGGGSSTVDASADAGRNHTPGFMTSGIDDPQAYYYRRVYADAVRMLEVAHSHPLVDASAIIVTGGSQGGGITLAAAGLAPMVGIDLLASAPDVPFLCHFARAVQLTNAHPYAEITKYLSAWRDQVEQAYTTLSYFDGVNLARRANAPTLFSVGLMDPVCPPSTIFTAYNAYGQLGNADVARQINVYSHNEHEGGAGYQVRAQLEWFRTLFA